MDKTVQLKTPRLTLVAASLEHLRIELEAPKQLEALLDAEVSAEWPTGEYDRDAMEFFRDRLEEGGRAVEGWYCWYAVKEADVQGSRALVGGGGYFGPPNTEGIVEIGYSILPAWQRKGYASELVEALCKRAFSYEEVSTVIAHTTKENAASVGVLRRCGFHEACVGREEGTVRFERYRSLLRFPG